LVDMLRVESDALAFEYKRDYGTAGRNLDVAHLVNNPAASGKCSVFGLSFQEKAGDVFLGEPCSLFDHRPYAFLVAANPVQPFK